MKYITFGDETYPDASIFDERIPFQTIVQIFEGKKKIISMGRFFIIRKPIFLDTYKDVAFVHKVEDPEYPQYRPREKDEAILTQILDS